MLERHSERAVIEALEDTPVVLIHGPRQAGKSTLAERIAAERFANKRVTLDDPLAMQLARSDPAAFLAAYKPPVFIDEVQRAPELFLAMKLLVDRDRKPGKFLLTGSANVLALPKMADSLAGRMEIVDLLPFSQGELHETPDGFVDACYRAEFEPAFEPGEIGSVVDRIVRGGFPEPSLRASAARRQSWFANYVRTILDRDVRDIAYIEALAQMPTLFSLLAARSGSTLNIATLATDTGIPYTSLKRYLGLLQTIFLLRVVPAWTSDRAKTFTKAPKSYIVDTGLLCYFANWDAKSLLADPLRLKQVLENFVAMELAKQCSFGEQKPWLLHLRTVRHLQVDFVLESRGGDVVGIEVKPTPTLRPSDADGLRFLQDLAGPRFKRGLILYLGDEIRPLGEHIWALPISALWQTP